MTNEITKRPDMAKALLQVKAIGELPSGLPSVDLSRFTRRDLDRADYQRLCEAQLLNERRSKELKILRYPNPRVFLGHAFPDMI
jgi:hypothetical protein